MSFFNEHEEQFIKVMKERGHEPIMNTYDPTTLDVFVYSEGFCNGPGCKTCGWSCCYHCDKDAEKVVPMECVKD